MQIPGWLRLPHKIMIDKKIAKRYKDLLKVLNEENNNLKERAKRNNKIRENLILRSLEDKKDI
tara:strand:+ start:498 stop:686 length:189 start_codon:yes stop_codon:yes gene_type:complete